MKTEKYYTRLPHLIDVFDAKARQMAFTAATMEEYGCWKTALRSKLIQITGIDRMDMCKPEPQLLESKEIDGCRRDKIIIQTEPDVWAPMYVFIPNGLSGAQKNRCIIAAHGHLGSGKNATAGRNDIPMIRKSVKKHNYGYGLEFAKRGYIVFCPDASGFGERREHDMQGDTKERFMSSSCSYLNDMAISLGRSLTGMWVWDLMRLIDYIGTREDCDLGRLGCVGLSGGGLQTLWLAALDERVKCAVVSGYFYGYKDALMLRHCCDCNYVPNLWTVADMGDIAALIAPRPLLIETGALDWLNGDRGMPNVYEQADITRGAYRLHENKGGIDGCEDRFVHHVFEGDHQWHGGKAYDFVAKWL